jgi:hypothetical protein
LRPAKAKRSPAPAERPTLEDGAAVELATDLVYYLRCNTTNEVKKDETKGFY